MTPEILYEEAVSLARSSTLLKDEGLAKDLAAVWKAGRTIEKDDENYVHRISIDCKYLSKDLGLRTGCISLYLGEDDASDLFSLHEPNLKLGELIKESYGTPLYAQPSRSLPHSRP